MDCSVLLVLDVNEMNHCFSSTIPNFHYACAKNCEFCPLSITVT